MRGCVVGVTIASIVAIALLGAGPISADNDSKPDIDCRALETSAGRVPPEVAEVCTRLRPSGQPAFGPTDTGYGLDVYPGYELVSFTLNNFASQTVAGSFYDDFYPGADFDPTATTLYVLDYYNNTLGTLSLSDASHTVIGPCAPNAGESWTGLSIDSTGVAWASACENYGAYSAIYTVNLTTGTPTLATTVPNLGVVIDIAMDSSGVLWAHDIVTDAIYTIDTTTGAETFVGYTGYSANYAQGMDFDYSDGTLYVWLYSSGTIFGTVNLATGAVTQLATDSGEFEGAVQVAASENLGCGSPMVEFESGIPLTFSVVDDSGGTGILWDTTLNSVACPEGNITPSGTGECACADSNASGVIEPYDTSLVSNSFDLSAAGAAVLNASIAYTDLDTGSNDFFDIDVSTDGGSSWANEVHWDGDMSMDLSHDISAYVGQADVRVRFRYAGDGYDWYVYMDNVEVTCVLPAITMNMTVDTVAGCGGSDSIQVAPGTGVYYCYEVTNIGNVDFDLHDLFDDQLGTVLSAYSQPLPAGTSGDYETGPVTILTTTTSTATWHAYAAAHGYSADAQASATVTVVQPEPLICNGAAVNFDIGLAPDWVVIDNAGNGVVWTTTGSLGYPDDCGDPNYTGGSALSACVSSDNYAWTDYDTELRAAAVDLTGMFIANLGFAVNYQDFTTPGGDHLDVDYSTDGVTWNNLSSWDENHGTLFGAGTSANVDLAAAGLGNQPVVLLRWHYYSPDSSPWDWYAQIDDVSLSCAVPVELQSFTIE